MAPCCPWGRGVREGRATHPGPKHSPARLPANKRNHPPYSTHPHPFPSTTPNCLLSGRPRPPLPSPLPSIPQKVHLSKVSSACGEKLVLRATTPWYRASRRCTSSLSVKQKMGKSGLQEEAVQQGTGVPQGVSCAWWSGGGAVHSGKEKCAQYGAHIGGMARGGTGRSDGVVWCRKMQAPARGGNGTVVVREGVGAALTAKCGYILFTRQGDAAVMHKHKQTSSKKAVPLHHAPQCLQPRRKRGSGHILGV